MSLVGTRPILQDELQKYELHHRARIAIKPGITGMWQVSGRSDMGWTAAMSRCSESAITHRFTPTRMSVPQRQNRSRENKWKALCGNYVGGVLGVPHGLLSGGVLLIKMFDKL